MMKRGKFVLKNKNNKKYRKLLLYSKVCTNFALALRQIIAGPIAQLVRAPDS